MQVWSYASKPAPPTDQEHCDHRTIATTELVPTRIQPPSDPDVSIVDPARLDPNRDHVFSLCGCECVWGGWDGGDGGAPSRLDFSLLDIHLRIAGLVNRLLDISEKEHSTWNAPGLSHTTRPLHAWHRYQVTVGPVCRTRLIRGL
jgi:hypothetical protein